MDFQWIFYLPGKHGLCCDPKDDFNCENPAKGKKKESNLVQFNLSCYSRSTSSWAYAELTAVRL